MTQIVCKVGTSVTGPGSEETGWAPGDWGKFKSFFLFFLE